MAYDNHIVDAVRDTLVQAGSTFRGDQKRAYQRAIGNEVNDTARWTLETILENAEIAERNRSPLCDDTGIPHLLLEIGPNRAVTGEMMDAILTSEDFAFSKPHPDCYERGAARFGLPTADCVVFEDSLNGLRSGRSAGCTVVGLSTTLPADAISALCDIQLADYTGLTYDNLCDAVSRFATKGLSLK